MIDPQMTDQLTNPFDGIRAVCPKCQHETPGTFGKYPTGGPYRAFECSACGLRYQVDNSDVNGVMIGSRVDGYNSDFKKRAVVHPEPDTSKGAGSQWGEGCFKCIRKIKNARQILNPRIYHHRGEVKTP